MSVVDFIQLGSHLLALDATGRLLAWDLTPQVPSSDSCLLRSQWDLHITSSLPLRLLHVSPYIFVCAADEILRVQVDSVQDLHKIANGKDKEKIQAMKLEGRDEGDQIKCIVGVAMQSPEKENQMQN